MSDSPIVKSPTKETKTLIINLFGGPGTGKSTTAAGVFAFLKWKGVNCEMALEYAKDCVWDKSRNLLDNQIFVFGQQHHRIWRLLGQVDVVISDSPLLHSVIYDSSENPHFSKMVTEEHRRLLNLNIFLVREKPYQQIGRLHTEEQAREIDQKTRQLLESLGETFEVFPGNTLSVPKIANLAHQRFVEENSKAT